MFNTQRVFYFALSGALFILFTIACFILPRTVQAAAPQLATSTPVKGAMGRLLVTFDQAIMDASGNDYTTGGSWWDVDTSLFTYNDASCTAGSSGDGSGTQCLTVAWVARLPGATFPTDTLEIGLDTSGGGWGDPATSDSISISSEVISNSGGESMGVLTNRSLDNVDITAPAEITNVTLADSDTNTGLDGRDFTISFDANSDNDFVSYYIYLAPSSVSFDPWMYPYFSNSQIAFSGTNFNSITAQGTGTLSITLDQSIGSDSIGDSFTEQDYTAYVQARDGYYNYSMAAASGATGVVSDSAAASGDLRLNEVNWAGSSASSSDEWIELYNTATTSINLTDWLIENGSQANGDLTLDSATCGADANYTIPGEGYYLIANFGSGHSLSNLNISPDCLGEDINLNDDGATNGNLVLKSASNVTINTATTTSGWPAGDSSNFYSMEQVSGSWSDAATTINLDSGVSDRGTPKAPNGTDNTKPTLSSALGTADTNSLRVVFSEPLDATTAEQAANYSLDNGLTVGSANIDFANDSSGATVRLYLSSGQSLPAASVTVTVSNVQDAAGNPISASSTVSFTPSANSGGDTTPPDIMHSPIGRGWSDSDLTFFAEVTDTSNLSYVRLYFRQAGTSNYTEVSMNPLGSSIYKYTLDIDSNSSGTDFTDKDIEYYIKAEDEVGNIQTVPEDMRYGTGAPYWIARSGNTASGVTVTGASGAVQDGDGNAVSGAYVFIDGFGIPAATTTATGAFTLNNVPPGWFDFVFVASGYAPHLEQGIDTNSAYAFSSGAVTFNANTGDSSNPPSVDYTGPADGETYVPADIYEIMIGFSEPMKSSTIGTSTITLADASGSSVSGSVSYDSYYNEAYFQLDSYLEPSTTYTLTVSTGVKDSSSTPLPTAYTATFTTGQMYASSDTGTGRYLDDTCPFIENTMPQMGAMSFPTNGTLSLKFSGAMATSTLTSSNIKFYPETQGEANAASWSSSSYDSTYNTFSITFSGLTASTDYELHIYNSNVQDANGNALACGDHDFYAPYTTGSGDDSSSPTVGGHWPDSGATGIALTTYDINIGFSESLDSSTISTTSISLSPAVSGTEVEYEPEANMVHLYPGGLLSTNTTYTVTVAGNTVKDLAGNKLDGNEDGTGGDDYTFTFTTETSNSDTDSPEIAYANADNFSIAVTFTEPMNHDSTSGSASVTNPANYTLWSPWDSANQTGTKLNISGKTITWDGAENTAIIENVSLNAGAAFKIKASNVKDISSQAISSGMNWATGTVLDNAETFGMLGPGQMMGEMDFGMKAMGQMAEVFPMNGMAGKTTQYFVDIPLQSQIPDGGKIILTFPQGFDVSGAALVATSSSYANQDINGPGPGTITISSVTGKKSSRAITIVLSGATNSTADTAMGFMDYLSFDLEGIVNSSIPKDFETNGYSVDIKTKNTSNQILESLTSAPIFISSPGTNRIWGYVETSAGDHSTALSGVTVYLGSPMTGPQEATTATSQDCNDDGSNESNACYYFSELPDGDFDVWIEPSFTVSGTDYRGASRPEMIWISSSNSPYSKDFTVSSTAGLLKVAGTITGPSGEKIMVWANNWDTGQWMEKEYTLTGGSVDYSIAVDAAGDWEVGVDPWHPTGPKFMGPPPEPDFVPPSPVRVGVADAGSGNTTLTDYSTTDNAQSTVDSSGSVTSGAGIDFSLSGADQRIKGYVVDASDNPIPNAEVWAYNPGGMGMGAHTQSANDGSFTLKVGTGLLKVGAHKPGMPFAPEKRVEVFADDSQTGGGSDGNSNADVMREGSLIVDKTGDPTTASNPLVVRIKKSSYTISGKVLDSSDNVISGASVWAYQLNAPGHSETFTSSDGSYTLYVPSTGTWTVEADAPGYGFLGSKSVTVSSDNTTPSGKNFSPSSNLAEISGSVSGLSDASGVNIWAEKTDYSFFNDAFTGADGDYTLRLEYSDSTSTNYNIGAWSPEVGDFGQESITLDTSGNVSSGTTTFSVAGLNTVTINSQDNSGSGLAVEEMYVDFYDSTNYFGRNIKLENASTSDLSLPDGDYEIHVWVPGFAESDLTVSGAGVATSSGLNVLTVDGAETVNIKQPASGGANLKTVSGTVTSDGSGVESAWVWMDKLTGAGGDPTGVHRDTETSATGTFSVSVTDGYYMMGVDKPGYTGPNPTEVQITADSSGNDFTLTQNTLTISGRVWADSDSSGSYDSGEGIESAWVWGEKRGGGWAGITTETDGSYELSVSSGEWDISAASDRYKQASYSSNPVDASGSPSGINIELTETRDVKKQRTKSMTPANGGTFDDKSNSGVKVTVPPNALGNDTNEGQVKIREKNSVPSTSNRKPALGSGKQINATDNSGRAVTNLSGSIDIEIDVTKSEVDSAVSDSYLAYSELDGLSNGYWDDTKNNWVDITTTKTVVADGSSVDFNTFAANVASSSDAYSDYTITLQSSSDHLSDFAPLVPKGSGAPATPSGLSATGSTSGTASVTLTWNANSESDLAGYYVYRSTDGGSTYPLLADAGNVTSYTDSSSLSTGTTYYYKIAAYDDDGNESAATSRVSATPTTTTTGGSVSPSNLGDTSPPQISDISVTAQATEATLSWETSEASLSWLVYGTSTDYGLEQKTTSYISSHSIALTDLAASTTYHYQVKAEDDNENISSYTDKTFTTLAKTEEEKVEPEAEQVPTVPEVGVDEGDLIRLAGGVKVYVIKDGARQWISSPVEFAEAGYKWEDVQEVSQSEFESFAPLHNLVQVPGKPEVYLVKEGLALHIATLQVFNQAGFVWGDIEEIAQETLAGYTKTNLVQVSGTPEVYVLDGERRTWIKTPQEFESAGYNWSKIMEISSAHLDAYSVKESMALAPLLPSQPSGDEVKITASLLNVRSEPSLTGRILAKVQKDDTLSVLEQSAEWFKVQVRDNLLGWISANYAQLLP